jgi:methyl-accepting chemotaxis protein
MKFRFSFTFRILVPYLVLAVLFLLVFLIELDGEHAVVRALAGTGILASILVGLVHVRWLGKPFYRVRNQFSQLARGIISSFSASGARDEIGDLEREMEKHLNYLQSLTHMARTLSEGDFSGEFRKLSSDDEIGEAMLSLKASLMDSQREAEYRRKEEEHRTWNAQGLAKFSRLFREAEDDLGLLSRDLTRELVSYTDADVGALFITREKDGKVTGLELTGSYAFDREKHIQRSFEFGEGLVGRAAVEKESIYVTELPPDYVKIRSGLGEDVPASLLLVPVMLDNRVLGVIELASLGELPAYQIELVRQLGDALASTLTKVKANLQNRILFEQTKEQAEALASQEQVFRQKLEELEKEKAASAKREESMQKEIKKLKRSFS